MVMFTCGTNMGACSRNCFCREIRQLEKFNRNSEASEGEIFLGNSQFFRNSHRRCSVKITHVLESLFNKVAGIETTAQLFFSEICESFKNTNS